jgi:hypothetical protein
VILNANRVAFAFVILFAFMILILILIPIAPRANMALAPSRRRAVC